MNKKQLFATANEDEKRWLIILTAQAIEERKQRVIFSRGRLLHEKRGNFPGAHFLNDRRRLRRSLPSVITRLSYIFILLTVSVATWLFVLYAPAQLAIPVMLLHLVGLTAVLLFKPYRSITHFARSA